MRTIIKDYAFIDKEGREMTRERHERENVSHAYAFFATDTSGEDGDCFAKICDYVNPISSLNMKKMSRCSCDDGELINIAKHFKKKGTNCVLEARCLNGTNEDCADDLADVLNNLYQTSFYNKGVEEAIVYEENGKYIFRE